MAVCALPEPTPQFPPFAHAASFCETRSMRKLPNIAMCVLAPSLTCAGMARARQTSATNPSTAPPAAGASAATDNSTPAAKPATTAKPAATSARKTQNAASSQNGTAAPASGAAKTQSGTATKTPAGAAAQHHAAAPPLVLKTDKDKESYAIGLNIGKSIHRDGVDVDPNVLSRGMKDALSGAKPALTDDEAKAVMMSLQTRVRKQHAEQAQVAAEAAKKVGEANKAAGDAFLAANKTKEGVGTLPRGLQYKILPKARARSPPRPIPWCATTKARCSTTRNSTAPTRAISRSRFRCLA